MFIITSWLQVFRGSRLDTIIFLSSTVVVWLSAAGIVGDSITRRIKVKRSTIFAILFVYSIVLSLVTRHTYEMGFLVVAILPFVIGLVWYRDSGKKEKADTRIARAKGLWLVLCLGITAWEFMANILGQLVNSLHIYPTLSVLIDPWLDYPMGQAAFVVLWLITGVGFLGLWRNR